MTLINVHLDPDEAEQLRALSREERRSPRGQAALLVVEGLERRRVGQLAPDVVALADAVRALERRAAAAAQTEAIE